jgi:hypothetical protein
MNRNQAVKILDCPILNGLQAIAAMFADSAGISRQPFLDCLSTDEKKLNNFF